MVCLGVPTLRPLYLRQRGMTIGYSDRANTHATDPELPLFTMCEQKPGDSKPPAEKQAMKEDPQEKSQEAGPIQEKHYSSSPEPKSFLRDSSSSRTAVESSPSPEPCLPMKPESVRTRDRSDSVDDILGLYDSDRSRSRGRNAPIHTDISQPAEIWLRSEFQVDVERQDSAWPLSS
jgi:hypothetical protein